MPRLQSVVRIGVIIATVGAGLLVGIAPVAAQTYESGLTVSNDRPAPGSVITVRAGGFTPNDDAEILFDSMPLAVAPTDANGTATRVVTIPSSASTGQHIITIAYRGDRRAPIELSKTVSVQTGGSAFSQPDGNSASAFLLVALLIVAVTGPVLVRRSSALFRR